DRRLLKLFRGVARRTFVVLGDGRIYYHLTHIDDLVEGFRLCGEVPHAAGRTYILAGAQTPTLNELIQLIAAEAGDAPSSRLALLARRGRLRSALRAVRSRTAALPPARGLFHEEPRLRHLPRAPRTRLRPRRVTSRRHPAHARLVPTAELDLIERSGTKITKVTKIWKKSKCRSYSRRRQAAG